MTPQEYVAEVVRGKRKDPTLSFQLANDLIVLDVVPEYLDDPDSRGYRNAARMVESGIHRNGKSGRKGTGSRHGGSRGGWRREHTFRPRENRDISVFAAPNRVLRGICDTGGVLRAQRAGVSLSVRAFS